MKAQRRCIVVTSQKIDYEIEITNLNSRITTVTQLPDVDAPCPDCFESTFLFEFEAPQELIDLIEMLRFATSFEWDDCYDQITRMIMPKVRKHNADKFLLKREDLAQND